MDPRFNPFVFHHAAQVEAREPEKGPVGTGKGSGSNRLQVKPKQRGDDWSGKA